MISQVKLNQIKSNKTSNQIKLFLNQVNRNLCPLLTTCHAGLSLMSFTCVFFFLPFFQDLKFLNDDCHLRNVDFAALTGHHGMVPGSKNVHISIIGAGHVSLV